MLDITKFFINECRYNEILNFNLKIGISDLNNHKKYYKIHKIKIK